MLQLRVSQDDVGIEYLEELNEILNIRKNRRNIYGDSFLIESVESIISIIDGKRRRFETIFQKLEKSAIDKEKLLDELHDVVNYYIFLLCIIKNR